MEVNQEGKIKATLTATVDKFDAKGNFLDSITESKEVWLSPQEVQDLQQQAEGGN